MPMRDWSRITPTRSETMTKIMISSSAASGPPAASWQCEGTVQVGDKDNRGKLDGV
jgi:hypothetical protein